MNTCILALLVALLLAPPIRTEERLTIRGYRGANVYLPCGNKHVNLDEANSYVVWLKYDKEFLYRYPEVESAERTTSAPRDYPICTQDSFCFDNTSLLVKNLRTDDSGYYTCRIYRDGHASDEHVVIIQLVEPAGMPCITTETGESPEKLNPIPLGSNFTLICHLEDGPKDATLFWKRNGIPMKMNILHGENSAMIHITNVTRAENGIKYECLAKNAHVTLKTNFTVQMIFPPASAWLSSQTSLILRPGELTSVQCFVEGSYPVPNVSWYLGDVPFASEAYNTFHENSVTVSTLTFTPKLLDSNKTLKCSIKNPKIDGLIEPQTKVYVGDTPTCATSGYSVIGAVPGEVEIIICTVVSALPPTSFAWEFSISSLSYQDLKGEDRIIKEDSNGNYYTRFTWLPTRVESGIFFCQAENKFGIQNQPCMYKIMHGRPPIQPSCQYHRSKEMVKVRCLPKWDGGRPQKFHVEIFDFDHKMISNTSSSEAKFDLPMIINTSITLVIYASNVRGRSQEDSFDLPAFKQPAPTPKNYYPSLTDSQEYTGFNGWKRLLIFIGITVCIVASALVFACIIYSRWQLKRNRAKSFRPSVARYFNRPPLLLVNEHASPAGCIPVSSPHPERREHCEVHPPIRDGFATYYV